MEEALTSVDWDQVQAAWRKTLERRSSDPEGAITAARTLMETVCKHILSEAGTVVPEKADLPDLYGLTALHLDLAPSTHTERTMKQLLGGCFTMAEGIGALTARLSDAHGKAPDTVTAEPRHAELAVNLAGALASFLITSVDARRPAMPCESSL